MPIDLLVLIILAIGTAFVAGVVVGFLWCRAIMKRWVREAAGQFVKRQSRKEA